MTSTKWFREVLAAAEAAGIVDAAIDNDHRRHPRIIGTVRGRAIRIGICRQPHDQRAIINVASIIRRAARGGEARA